MAERTPIIGSFTEVAVSAAFTTRGGFNISLSGFGVATVRLERSFDHGVTWVLVIPYTSDIERRVDDPEVNVYYRFNCITHAAGTIVYRMSS